MSVAAWMLPAGDARAGEVSVLDVRYRWRVHITMRTPVVHDEKGAVSAVDPKTLGRRGQLVDFSSAPPPDAWTGVDFDDRAWPRARGPFTLQPRYSFGSSYHAHHFARFCLRGTFRVDDPGRANGMKLSLSYRGGAVVYINGKEIARGNLPKGKLGVETLAADYPREVFVDAGGKSVPSALYCKKNTEQSKLAAKRLRRLEGVSIPTSALRKGMNVLAVALYRAPLAKAYLRATRGGRRGKTLWTQLGFMGLSLTAPAGAPVTPGGSALKGMQVFNARTSMGLFETDRFDSWVPLRPVEMMACRNAAVSGQVVLCSPRPIRGAEARISGLKRQGAGDIPASAIEIRYARADLGVRVGRKQLRRFDALEEAPPAETPVAPLAGTATLPVWLTIKVPKDAAAGRYEGVLHLKAQGMPEVKIPIGLEVADFALPDIGGYASYSGIVQSPDSLALKYKVTPWSEQHWQLIARSFGLLGRVGNDCLIVPLVRRTFYGNAESMVRWIRKKDGSLAHDLKRLERYLDCAVKASGSPKIVCLCVWEPVDAYKSAGPEGKGIKMEITVVEASGKVGTAPAPGWGTPECRSFWKPVFDDIRKMLAARGLERSMCVGSATQAPPGKVVCADMEAIAPGIKWFALRHEWWQQMGGRDTAISVGVYGSPGRSGPGKKQKYRYVWQDPRLWALWPRTSVCNLKESSSPVLYRLFMDRTMIAGISGIGSLGADFWPVVPAGRKRFRPVLGTNWSQLGLGAWGTPSRLLAAGSKGPVGTVRLEMLREGTQDAEVRVLIEKALVKDATKAKLGTALEKQAREVLHRYTQAILMARPGNHKGGGGTFGESLVWYAGTLRAQRKALYEVAAKLPKP